MRPDMRNEQRHRLARKGKRLTPSERQVCCQIVRRETILAWFRRLAAQKYDGSKSRKAGRPRKAVEIRQLVLKLRRQSGLGVLQDPRRAARAPHRDRSHDCGRHPRGSRRRTGSRTRRQLTWKQFLRSHAETMYACDFFSVEVLSLFGTIRTWVLFVIHVKSRAVRITGIRVAPDGGWIKQAALNLVDPIDGFLRDARYLVHDRDPLFTEAWTALLKTAGVTCVPIPAQSPNCNAYAERFVRTVRSECLDHFVIFGQRHLRPLLLEFVEHYLEERYHQGIGGRIIDPSGWPKTDDATTGGIECRSRLGGALNFYRRAA